MNLKEFVSAIAVDFVDKAKSGATDIAYEATFETIIASYKQFCLKFVERYIKYEGTDSEILKAFRARFMRMVKLSMISIDEVDAYLTCVYVNKKGQVLQICMSAEQVKREVIRGTKTTKGRK